MKVVIDIPRERYEWILNTDFPYNSELNDMIRNGKPLPKGHWIKHHNDNLGRCMRDTLECSVCGKCMCESPYQNFCPCCGAEMEGEKHE